MFLYNKEIKRKIILYQKKQLPWFKSQNPESSSEIDTDDSSSEDVIYCLCYFVFVL
jgi:tRNA A37 N6-isopentenylltransferase MiaA